MTLARRATALDGLFSDGEEDPGDTLDVGGFRPGRSHPKLPRDVVRNVSLEAGLEDRTAHAVPAEPKPPSRARSAPSEFRRSVFYRTGRSVQINMKGRSDDRDRLDRMCDGQEWVRGQLLEYALDALAEKIEAGEDDPFWRTRSFRGVDPL